MTPIRLLGRSLPTGRHPVAGQQTCNHPRLVRQIAGHRGDLILAGTPGDVRHRCGTPIVAPEDRAALEDGQVVLAARGVPGHRREQTRQQSGAHEWLGVGQRIGQPHRGAAGIIDRQAEPVQLIRAHERQRQQLHETCGGNSTQHRAPRALREGVASARWCRRHSGAHHAEADLASDLLDVVVLVDKIGTPGGRHQAQPLAARAVALARNLDTGRSQHLNGLLGADRSAQDARGQVGADALDGHRRRLADHGIRVGDGASAKLGHQSGSHPGSGQRQRRVNAAREPGGRLGRQLVSTEGASDGHRIETCRLEHDVAGGRCQLGGLAAHHAGQADRPGVVGNQQVVWRQLADDIIKGGQPFPRRSLPDHDRALQPVSVVSVQRLPGLQHHIVGDVDVEADRTHPGGHQPSRHPGGRGSVRVDVLDRQRNEDRAVLGLQSDRVATLGRAHATDQVGVGERDPECLGGLAGDAAHAEAVADVGGDVDLQHFVAGLQHFHGVGTQHLRAAVDLLGQHHDAVVVGAQAQLVLGADHAVRHAAVGLAGGDLEATGQHCARQCHHDVVAALEVAGAADDPARRQLADVHLTPADHLAVALRLLGELQDASHHHRPADLDTRALDALHLQARAGERVRDLGGGDVGGQRDQFTQP